MKRKPKPVLDRFTDCANLLFVGSNDTHEELPFSDGAVVAPDTATCVGYVHAQ